MSAPVLQGVIFDLDGTLYTLRGLRPRMALELWPTLRVLHHLSGARRAIRQREFQDGTALAETLNAELARRSGIGRPQVDTWYQGSFLPAFVKVLDRHGQRRPGLLPLLARLRTGGILLAVVSDFPKVDERLRALGIPPEAFHLTLSAEECGALKPSPQSLLEVAWAWSLEPSRVLVVGDRPDLDEASAAAAGMEFLGVSNRHLPGRRRRPGYVSWPAASNTIAIRTGIGAKE